MATYTLFTGFAEAWPASWSGAHTYGDDTVQLQAVDATKILNLATISLTRGQELSGTRINAVLDAISWPAALRDIDQGQSNVQAATLEDTNALAHIQETAASEGGIFFVSREGIVTFFDRFHTTLLDETNDTWGDDGTEKRYASITTSFDDDNLWNRVIVTAPNLTDQMAEDSTSQSLYAGPGNAPRVLSVPTSLTTEAEMLDRATFYLSKYSEPHFRITSLLVDNGSLDDTQWPRLLPQEIHDRILVRKRIAFGDDIEQPSFVEGLDWDISPGSWRMTRRLSSTPLQEGQWELGTVGLSELGETTTLVGL